MSKGSPIVSVRFPPLLLAAIQSLIRDRNAVGLTNNQTLTEWMLIAASRHLDYCVEFDESRKEVTKRPPRKKSKTKVR